MTGALEGRVALVTGASRGIGRGIALALGAAGADVALVGRGEAELGAVADGLAALGRRAWVLPGDITREADLDRVFAGLDASAGALDVLVNNAGMNIPEPFVAVSLEHFDRLFGLNVRAAFAVTQRAVRRMLAGGRGGRVVTVTSQMGRVGGANRTVYCATKHALEGFSKALALELAPHGITANCVAPTFVATDFTRPMFEDAAFRASVVQQIPLGRVAEVDDVTGAVVFLASPAARFVTGASLAVDGGWTAR